jgi:hypothetical protein
LSDIPGVDEVEKVVVVCPFLLGIVDFEFAVGWYPERLDRTLDTSVSLVLRMNEITQTLGPFLSPPPWDIYLPYRWPKFQCPYRHPISDEEYPTELDATHYPTITT